MYKKRRKSIGHQKDSLMEFKNEEIKREKKKKKKRRRKKKEPWMMDQDENKSHSHKWTQLLEDRKK